MSFINKLRQVTRRLPQPFTDTRFGHHMLPSPITLPPRTAFSSLKAKRFQRRGLGSLGDRIRDYKGLGMGRRFPQMPMPQPMPLPPIQEYLPTDPLAPRQPINVHPQEYRPTVTEAPMDIPIEAPMGIPIEAPPVEQFGATVVPRNLEQPAPVEQFGATVVPRDMNAEYLSSLAEEMRRREMEETRNALARQEPLGMRGGGIANLINYYRR